MFRRKVDGESKEFAELRESLWQLCEISENVRKYDKSDAILLSSQPSGCINQKGQQRRKNMAVQKENKRSVFIAPEVWRAFKSLAVLQGRSVSDLLTEVITEKLEKEKQA